MFFNLQFKITHFQLKRKRNCLTCFLYKPPSIRQTNPCISLNPSVVWNISAKPAHCLQVTKMKPKWYLVFIPNRVCWVAPAFNTNPNTIKIIPKLKPLSLQFNTLNLYFPNIQAQILFKLCCQPHLVITYILHPYFSAQNPLFYSSSISCAQTHCYFRPTPMFRRFRPWLAPKII